MQLLRPGLKDAYTFCKKSARYQIFIMVKKKIRNRTHNFIFSIIYHVQVSCKKGFPEKDVKLCKGLSNQSRGKVRHCEELFAEHYSSGL